MLGLGTQLVEVDEEVFDNSNFTVFIIRDAFTDIIFQSRVAQELAEVGFVRFVL